ncbi:hypothetical protein EA473_01760 [Natrarchaeobius chitinivorans]|uniref:Uncharacterized protein n=1 Tax=Natrarchaeobius chitinivorans TaxID=1679083 RepID=A0A3N6MB94_NATCH|nr:hypothetical protein EA473_01760 [Natrarchaeobius chitinivorans]
MAFGLTISATGALVGASEHRTTDHDELVVTTDCEDSTNLLSIENPNDVPIELAINWAGDHSSLEIHSDGTFETAVQTDRVVEFDDTDERTETTTFNLTAELPANENVTIGGLTDGTYELTATGDGEDVSIDHTEVTLECGDESEDVVLTLGIADDVVHDDKTDEKVVTTVISLELETDEKVVDGEKKVDRDDEKTILDKLPGKALVNQPLDPEKPEKYEKDEPDEKPEKHEKDEPDEKIIIDKLPGDALVNQPSDPDKPEKHD